MRIELFKLFYPMRIYTIEIKILKKNANFNELSDMLIKSNFYETEMRDEYITFFNYVLNNEVDYNF